MRINRTALDAIREHAAEGYPNEICGIMIGPPKTNFATEVRRAGNIIGQRRSRWEWTAERTVDRYELDPLDQIRVEREARLAGLDIIGYYHSHPDHPARASITDSELSYSGYVYVIVSVDNGIPIDVNAFVTERDKGPLLLEPLEVVETKPV